MMKGFLLTVLISLLFLTSASCSGNYFTHNGEIWGTTYHIVYQNGQNIDNELDSIMRYIDAELSMFNPASLVSAINSGESDSISVAFAEVFDIASRVSRLSGGVYDPTVGPLTELWGFGRGAADTLPSSTDISEALSAVGISECRIEGCRIIKKAPATLFDFSSVAKGYGIDLVCRHLESRGADNYMVEIGGEVRTLGRNPRGRDWHIQIDMPRPDTAHSRLAIVSFGPEGKAMASSGNYRNFRKLTDGSIYGHTLSAVSGYPVESELAAVTVIADDCAAADALATACMASGNAGHAIRIIEAWPGAEMLAVIAQADTAVVLTSAGFNSYLADI